MSKVNYASVVFKNDDKYGNQPEYGTKQYVFKTDLNLVSGDLVVCDTSKGINVALVKKVDTVDSTKATKWIICKVELEKHNERLLKEEKLKVIKAKMDKRKKELEDINFYMMLAEKDDDMRKMLEEYNSIEL